MNFVCLSEPNRHLHVSLVALLALCALSSGCEEETAANNQDHAAQEATARDLTAHTHEGGESCFICDPSQREAGRLWCEEHGRPTIAWRRSTPCSTTPPSPSAPTPSAP